MAGESTTTEPVSGPRVHDIGAGGIVVVAAEAADVRIQGVEGTEVRVVAPADGAGIATEAQPGRFTVRTLRHVGTDRIGFVGLKVGRREFGFPLGFRVSGTIEIEVPRDARVEVGVTAGDVAVRDVRGGAVVRTATRRRLHQGRGRARRGERLVGRRERDRGRARHPRGPFRRRRRPGPGAPLRSCRGRDDQRRRRARRDLRGDGPPRHLHRLGRRRAGHPRRGPDASRSRPSRAT